MAYFKQEKPEKKGVSMEEAMKGARPMSSGMNSFPGIGGNPEAKKPEPDTAKASKSEGMGVGKPSMGKPLVAKNFKDGEDQYKITVTKIGGK